MSSKISTRPLGKSGITVGEIGLGCMDQSSVPFAAPGTDPSVSREPWFDVMKKAIEMGCNFFNTGEFYGDNEEVLKEFFSKNPDLKSKVFVSVKAGARMPHLIPCGEPSFIKENVDFNLKKMGVDKIDLYQCARVDRNTPIEITIKAIAECIKEGKVGYIGLSECDADTIRRAHKVHPITCVEVEYSLWTRDPEEMGIIKACEELGIAIVVYSPLGRGMLTGAYKNAEDAKAKTHGGPRFSEENFDKNIKLVEAITEMAKKLNITPAQLAISWVLHQSPNIIPIPGTTKVERLVSNLEASKVKLSKEQLDQIRSIINSNQTVGGRYPAHVDKMSHGSSISLEEYNKNQKSN